MKKLLIFITTTVLLGSLNAMQNSVTPIETNSNIEEIKDNNKTRLEAYTNARKYYYQIQTHNPPECVDYSTEGVCSLPNTDINGFPNKGHVNTILNYKFPKNIANYTAKYIVVYNTEYLGYSIKYESAESDVIIDIYIYGPSTATEIDEAFLKEHTQQVALDVKTVSPNAVFEKNYIIESFKNDANIKYYGFFASIYPSWFDMENKKGNSETFALLFSKNGKIIKFRITQKNSEKESFKKLVNEFIETFDNEVILDSKTRKEKFEPTIVYPIIDEVYSQDYHP